MDDEESILKLFKQCLETQGGMNVDSASSVDVALRMLETGRFDVVVSDYQMPKKDGLAFLKELRDNHNSIPFILFTGKGREEVAIKALNLGADQYINKTGDVESTYCGLAQSIRSAVKNRQASEEKARAVGMVKAVLDSTNDGLLAVSDEGEILLVNPRFREMWRIPESLRKVRNTSEAVSHILSQVKDPASFMKIATELANDHEKHFCDTVEMKDGRILEQCSRPLVLENSKPGRAWSFHDITERRKAQAELEQSERKFRSVFEKAKDYIVLLDLSGRVIDINEKGVEAFDASKDQIVGKHFSELGLFPIDTLQTLEAAYPKTVEGDLGNYENLVVRITNKGNKQLDLECSASLVTLGNQVTAVMVVARDVSEKLRLERAIKESEERYKSIVQLAPDGIITVDLNGIITSANPAFLSSIGYLESEIVGKNFAEAPWDVLDQDKARMIELFGRLMQGEVSERIEFCFKNKERTIHWAEARVALQMKEGKPEGVYAIVRDVTDRKHSEQQMREDRQKFQGLFSGNPEAAVYLGTDFGIVDANPRFLQLFGYSLNEICGKHINAAVVPEDKMEEADGLDKRAISGYVYHDTIRKRKDGALIPVSVSAAPIVVDGCPVGYVGIYKDISQQKEVEDKLATMNEKLRVVGSLTRHDIRNKLTAISGNVYLATKNLGGCNRLSENLREIGSASDQIVRILEFARDYEMLGSEELCYLPVDEAFDKAKTLFTDFGNVKALSECKDLSVLADSLLSQVFYNLIHNSLRHGQKVTQIKVSSRRDQGSLTLFYEDDGVGISPEDRENLFKEGRGKGTGYGLYLIHRIMEFYGWKIQEKGEYGKGVRFTMIIPETNVQGKKNYFLE